jgi:DNA-binding beta-propeller fold protein YncE
MEFLFRFWTQALYFMTGDATRKCLYVSERVDDSSSNPSSIVRKLDLTTGKATLFAGQLVSTVMSNTLMEFIAGGPRGLWAENDGTLFVADSETGSISAINPNTNEIRWFAGTWNDYGASVSRADEDANNALRMDGPAKQGKF